MIALVVVDPTTDRDDVEEFVILAIAGGAGALVMGSILGEESSVVAGAGAVTILGGIIGSGFRPVVSVHGPWWRKALTMVGLLAGVSVSFVFWP